MKEFICPIDKRIIILLPAEIQTSWQIVSPPFVDSFTDSIANCQTTRNNSDCQLIGFGCVGCRLDKEDILRQRIKPGSVVRVNIEQESEKERGKFYTVESIEKDGYFTCNWQGKNYHFHISSVFVISI